MLITTTTNNNMVVSPSSNINLPPNHQTILLHATFLEICHAIEHACLVIIPLVKSLSRRMNQHRKRFIGACKDEDIVPHGRLSAPNSY